MKTRRRTRVTQAKIRRALDAMIDVMQADDYSGTITPELDRACDALRAYRLDLTTPPQREF